MRKKEEKKRSVKLEDFCVTCESVREAISCIYSSHWGMKIAVEGGAVARIKNRKWTHEEDILILIFAHSFFDLL